MTLNTDPVTRAQERNIPTFNIERTITTRVGSSLSITEGKCPLATSQNNISEIAPVMPPIEIPNLGPNRSTDAPGINERRPALKNTAEIVSN
mmetsp:Transcript_25198/g.28259  ORF Transcript_25198/g.28259 Transcript_25198/m.28259 type:complete len:92 (+) Transcript_25198:1513-1788(+)